jgi:type I restriction enzyme S subunit
MIADLKPYAEYKESGLPWLGRVPGHWEVVPSKSLFGHRREKARKDDKMLTASQAHGIIARDEFMAIEGRRVMHVITGADILKHVEPNDFVMSMRSFQGGLEWSKVRGAISSAYVMLIPAEHVHPPYYARLLKSTPYIVALRRTSDLVRDGQALRYANFGQVPLPRVPKTEQAAIVRFLDWANGRLERAIRAKRMVIALLNEQKQAIIHRAVTRGLDPAVPLKSSGIPWLGDVPQHWEVRQLRHMGRLHKGVGGSKEDAAPEGVPCVRYGELYFHYKNFIRQPRGFVSVDKAVGYTRLRFGDVLFAASGERVEEIGKSAVNLYGGTAVCGGDVVIFRPTVAVHAAFLGYALDSYGAAHQKATMCRGTTIKHIYPDELRGLWFCVPPLSEQERIAVKLDNELLDSNNAISRLEREIELLREYRTRLVADVVTGKLDVREAASRLPVEAPLDMIEDDADPGDEAEAADEDAVA